MKPDKNRTCGTCRACCTALEVKGVPVENAFPASMTATKAAGFPCHHLLKKTEEWHSKGACGIYDHRPEPCRAWSCLWLKGYLASEDRPDAWGIIVDHREGLHPAALARPLYPECYTIHEVWDGAAMQHTVARFIDELARDYVVQILYWDGRRGLVGPNIRAEVFPRDENDHRRLKVVK